MSAPQSGSRSRHGTALDGAHPTRSIPAPTNGDSPRPDLSPNPGGGRRRPLTGADLYDWIALRRVNDGGIARVGSRWFDSGLRVPGYVTDTLTALCTDGLVALAEGDEWDVWATRRATLTEAGTDRYQRLCQQRRETRQPPESALTAAWLVDHPRAHTMVRSVWDILADLEQAGHHPGLITALRRILIHHQPTPTGRCRTCRRWRGRRRRFPCIVWHQIHTALR